VAKAQSIFELPGNIFMKVTQRIARTVTNLGFGKLEPGAPIAMEHMMLDRGLVVEQDHDMADQLKERRFPPTLADRKRTIQSPHFDIDRQEIVNPRHLAELIAEVEFNVQIPLFEKEMLLDRLSKQDSLEIYSKDHEKKLVKLITKKHKKLELPAYPEVYTLLEDVADRLY